MGFWEFDVTGVCLAIYEIFQPSWKEDQFLSKVTMIFVYLGKSGEFQMYKWVKIKLVQPKSTCFLGLNPILDQKFGMSWVKLALRVKKRVQSGRFGLK